MEKNQKISSDLLDRYSMIFPSLSFVIPLPIDERSWYIFFGALTIAVLIIACLISRYMVDNHHETTPTTKNLIKDKQRKKLS